MRTMLFAVVGIGLCVAVGFIPNAAAERPGVETDKIESLIKHVAELKDAKFVRNGREYDAKTAARFLRGKWDARASDIKTAKDFIEKVASVSSTTGKPYLIRFSDGTEVPSREYLTAELARIDKAGGK